MNLDWWDMRLGIPSFDWVVFERDIFLDGLHSLVGIERGMLVPTVSWKVLVFGFNELLNV